MNAVARALRAAAAAAPAGARGAATDAAARRQSFFELASGMPRFGVGARLRRATWRGEDCFWTVSHVRPQPDGRHGKAWGTLTWRGVEGPRQEIRGTLKPLWVPAEAPPPLSGPRL